MVQVKPFIRISHLWLIRWIVIFQALVGCHDIRILGKSPIKWRQRPDMTLHAAVDWGVKHQFKNSKSNKSKCQKRNVSCLEIQKKTCFGENTFLNTFCLPTFSMNMVCVMSNTRESNIIVVLHVIFKMDIFTQYGRECSGLWIILRNIFKN